MFAQSWKLVWAEEFNGTQLDETVWTRETGGNGWGNNELEYYTDRTTNSFVNNGVLTIVAQRESFGERDYTSARLKTQSKKFFKYGKIEAKIKLPYGKGIWSAFWMLGESISLVGWPASGEIDIMELIGGGSSGDRTVYGTAHWDDNGHKSFGLNYLNSTNFSNDFHVFSIIWDSLSIKWFVDDQQYSIINITSDTLSEFQNNFFIILNVAVGGNWPGSPDTTTVFPQKMEVDYVRVYQNEKITSTKNENLLPKDFNLGQNYPNPFNPTTTISYKLPQQSFVSLKVYDILGREIAVLVNEEKSLGYYTVNFNASEFANGIYFYRLVAGGFVETKRMVLLK